MVKKLGPASRWQCVYIVKTLAFSPIWENFPGVFRPTSFPPNVYAGFIKSVFLIQVNFQFSTPLSPNNHGPPTRVRCERVLFFPRTCHTQPKTHEPTITQSHRAPPLMWSAATCRRFELGDMSPSPQAPSCLRPPNHCRQAHTLRPPPSAILDCGGSLQTATSAARHRFRRPPPPRSSDTLPPAATPFQPVLVIGAWRLDAWSVPSPICVYLCPSVVKNKSLTP